MLYLDDCKVDEADDIILDTVDLSYQDDQALSTILCSGRRLYARIDDFALDNISAGLERELQQHVTPFVISNIKSAIMSAFAKHGLLSAADYDILVIDNKDRTVSVYIRFKVKDLNVAYKSYPYKVIINMEEQRVYR